MSTITVGTAGSRLVHTPPTARNASAPSARGILLGILALAAAFAVAIVAGVVAAHPAVIIASGLAAVLIVPIMIASSVSDALDK